MLCRAVIAMALGLSAGACTSANSAIQEANHVKAAADQAPDLPQTRSDEVVLGGPISARDIPQQFTAEEMPQPETITYAMLVSHLQQRGRLSLSSAELNVSSQEPLILVADELRLSNARVTTNGASLFIVVRRLIVDERSVIRSFPDPAPRGRDATQEVEGSDGPNGGLVEIFVLQDVDGLPRITLNGGDGGRGAVGSAGARGADGRRGRSARNGDFGSCRRGNGPGRPGGNGRPGSQGAPGYDGGDGGALRIHYVNAPPQAGITTHFIARRGAAGEGGAGGPGGAGGRGGRAGSGAGNCHDQVATRGRPGRPGATGATGRSGSSGQDGPFLVQTLRWP